MKVKQFHNKNQFIIKGEGQVTFQSYESIIADIKNGKLILHSDFDYSHTTQKHLYLFIDEFWCSLDHETRELLGGIFSSKNKRAFLQKLIDEKKIEYIAD